jgi:hypothetical protein
MSEIERVCLPSHIRRGRLSTTPTWFVTDHFGQRWQFQRKRDAQYFINRACDPCDREDCGEGRWACLGCGRARA